MTHQTPEINDATADRLGNIPWRPLLAPGVGDGLMYDVNSSKFHLKMHAQNANKLVASLTASMKIRFPGTTRGVATSQAPRTKLHWRCRRI